jgi:apolipoprotein N-acyltransferase
MSFLDDPAGKPAPTLPHTSRRDWRRSALCLAAGLVSACGFAPLDLWPLTLIGMAVLMWSVADAPRLRSALSRGWWFGLGQFVLGLNWIATAFTYQANMPAWLGWIAVLLLSLYLAIFPAATAGLAWRWGRRTTLRFVLIFAAAWIVTEYLRGVLFTGFPWNPLGASLLRTPASLFATLVGTYGLSGLAVLIAGILLLLVRHEWRAGAGLAAAVVAMTGIALLADPLPDGPPGAAVRVVQPGISQDTKHAEGYGPQLTRLQAAAGSVQGPSRLQLWPEDSIPYLLDEEPAAAALIGGWARPGDIILSGGAKFERDARGQPLGARNAVWIVDHDGRLLARYDKAHLVPFGEYLPWRSVMEPLGLARVVPGDLDFWEGPGPQTVDVAGFGKVGLQICYEIVFSGHVVDEANRPDFIFNPSNDAWFGSWGPPQHLAQARLRAIEEGLPVIRATPTGVSALIDAHGSLVQSIPLGEAGVIDANVPRPALPTLFSRVGNWMPFLFALLLIGAALIPARLQSRQKRAIGPVT